MQAIAESISKLVGGCTLIDSDGYWADVERANKDDYNDDAIGVENNVQLQVKGEVEKENCLEELIVNATIAATVSWPSVGVNWVCGHKVTADGKTVAFNFSVNENKELWKLKD